MTIRITLNVVHDGMTAYVREDGKLLGVGVTYLQSHPEAEKAVPDPGMPRRRRGFRSRAGARAGVSRVGALVSGPAFSGYAWNLQTRRWELHSARYGFRAREGNHATRIAFALHTAHGTRPPTPPELQWFVRTQPQPRSPK